MEIKLKTPATFKFKCTECGDCCRRPGIVEFDSQDFKETLAFLSLTRREFIAKYYCTEEEGDLVTLWVEEGRPCEFLHENRCSIFQVRPKQCRTYPFWEALLSEANWKAEAADCPGIGDGPEYTEAEIQHICELQTATKSHSFEE